MHEVKLTLPGILRIKKNSKRIFSRGRFKTVLPSEAYLKWEELARLFVKRKWPFPNPVVVSVEVDAQIYFTGPQPDLSGCLESIGDCLEGIAWKNDRQIISWDGSRLHHIDRKSGAIPRTEVTIRFEE